MDRQYDLFEHMPDNAVMWRGCVGGLEASVRKLKEIAGHTSNECVAIYLPARQVVALENLGQAPEWPAKRVIFQIAYDERLLNERAHLLSLRGYEVLSALGNGCAKVVLSARQYCDLFIVAHAAAEETRQEMVDWLKKEYPEVRILALNPPNSRMLAGADLNASLDRPDGWLSMIATAIG